MGSSSACCSEPVLEIPDDIAGPRGRLLVKTHMGRMQGFEGADIPMSVQGIQSRCASNHHNGGSCAIHYAISKQKLAPPHTSRPGSRTHEATLVSPVCRPKSFGVLVSRPT